MNILKKLSYGLMTCVALFAAAGCSDPDAEITELTLDRALRPTDVTVKVQDKVNAKISAYFVTVPQTVTYEFYTTTDGTNFTLERTDNPVIEADDQGTSHGTITYTAKKLSSETSYKLVLTSTYQGKTSGAVEVLFETDAEQILNDVTDDDITSSSVTLSWPAGETVTKIVVTKSGEVFKTVDLTADEIKAGKCVVTGLNKESTYTFTIYNGEKARGKQVVTTMPDYIPVYAGEGVDIQSVIDNAEEGNTIMLLPAKDGSTSTFSFVNEEGAAYTKDLTISKNVTISCLNTKPVTANISFTLDGCNGFTVNNLKLVDVSKSKGLINISNASGTINVQTVEVTGYKNFISNTKVTDCTINTFNVNNCFFHEMCTATRFIDLQSTRTIAIETLNIKQNTFASMCSGSDFIRIDYTAGKMDYTVNFENNTVYKVNAESKGMFYCRSNAAGDKSFRFNIKNNVFANLSDATYVCKDKKGDGFDYTANYYYSAPSMLVASGTDCAYDSAPKATDMDPKFKDAANGDYTITNDDIDGGNTEFAKYWSK